MIGKPTAFITFEGADGTGKSTQFALTSKYLKSKGLQVLEVREPGGSLISERIRELLLHGPDMDMLTELLLYMAARAENYKKVISQAVGDYDFIIGDRSIDSSVAYQGYARGLPIDVIKYLNHLVTDGYKPSVTYLMDLDPAIARRRLGDAIDRIEQEGILFQEKVRDGFLAEAAKDPERFVIIDGGQSPESCSQEIKQDIYRRFSEY